jgi:hypothetical protein
MKITQRASLRQSRAYAHPPQYNADPLLKSFTVRYKTSGAVASSIVDFAAICNTLIMADGVVHAYQICDAWKINSIEMWSTASAGATTSTVSVEWISGSSQFMGGGSNFVSDTSVGPSDVAHIRSSPPRGSIASNWLNPAVNENLMSINCPINTIIDVHYTARISANNAAANPGVIIPAANIGEIYCRALNSTAANNIIPLNLNNV